MAELSTLLERPDYGHEETLVWACANCARQRFSYAAVLVGGLIVCRDREVCIAAAVRMTRAARPAACPPPRIVLKKSRAPRALHAPTERAAPRVQSGEPRLPYPARPPEQPSPRDLNEILATQQRMRAKVKK